MTATSSAAELQRWLVDYLITNIGCDAGDIDFDRVVFGCRGRVS